MREAPDRYGLVPSPEARVNRTIEITAGCAAAKLATRITGRTPRQIAGLPPERKQIVCAEQLPQCPLTASIIGIDVDALGAAADVAVAEGLDYVERRDVGGAACNSCVAYPHEM